MDGGGDGEELTLMGGQVGLSSKAETSVLHRFCKEKGRHGLTSVAEYHGVASMDIPSQRCWRGL